MLSLHLPRVVAPANVSAKELKEFAERAAEAIQGLQFLVSILYLQANATRKSFESLGVDLPGPLGNEVSFTMRDYQDEVERRLGALEVAPAAGAPAKRRKKKKTSKRAARKPQARKTKASPKRRKAKKKKR